MDNTFVKNKKSQFNNKGAAMVLTITIIAVLIIFVFSLILVSYNLYASQNKNMSSMRNSEAVSTLSEALKDELTDTKASSNSNIWKYVRTNVAYSTTDIDWKDWPYYLEGATSGEHTEECAFRYFDLEKNSHIEGAPADIKVCMFWTLPDEYIPDAANPSKDAAYNPALQAGTSTQGIRLHVRITAITGGQTYEVEDIYKLKVKASDQDETVRLSQMFGNSAINMGNHELTDKVKNEKWIWKYEGRK